MTQKNDIENLISLFSKLPGLGQRSARRIVLHLLQEPEIRLHNLIEMLSITKSKIVTCEECYNLDIISPCNICSDHSRDQSVITIVESVADLWAMERAKIFDGTYHILGGALSASKNMLPNDLRLPKLIERCETHNIKEVILATNATIEGQTTAFFIMEQLKDLDLYISRIASGIPIGGELDYIDEGTLTAAMNSRKQFDN
jgi:recombination protein RecR